jgi:IS1 family transposase
LSAGSSKYIITNVKSSLDGTLNVPNGYTSGTTTFVANSVGARNSIKITDMSGSLSTSGAAITVAAWDVNGTAISESTTAAALTLYSHGTTTIAGTNLMARFPTGTPMSYEFTVGSSKYVITNVKSSTDGTINIPYAYTSGTTNFVANSIGARNTIKITDVSGSLSTSGAAITISAWDVNGNAIPESTTAAALKLYSRGTTSITGTNLAARFPTGTPMSYEFAVNSSKYIITNVKSSTDGTINIPAVYTSGTTTYASNDISSRSTIKITDASGSLSSSGAAITVAAWDVNGNAITESGSSTPLTLVNNGTTSITGTNLAARFPSGTPVSYEFTIGSSKYLVTNVTSNTDGTVTIPSVYSSGVAGGI